MLWEKLTTIFTLTITWGFLIFDVWENLVDGRLVWLLHFDGTLLFFFS